MNHSPEHPIFLYTLINQLFLQSSGIFPSVTIELHKSVTHLAPASPDAFNISATTPDGPAALPTSMAVIAACTSCTEIHSAGPLTSRTSSRLPLSQSHSSFNSLSK